MPRFRVAQVQFSEDGKPYPVNSRDPVVPGDFVIVRLTGKFTPLQKARVVSVDEWKGACKHSIVCHAEQAENYGGGPEAVKSEADLIRFLTDFVGMAKLPVVYRKNYTDKIKKKHPRWKSAFYTRSGFHPEPLEVQKGNNFVDAIVVLGTNEIMHYAPDRGTVIEMLDGAMVIGDNDPFMTFHSKTLSLEEEKVSLGIFTENLYSRIAKFAEGNLAVDLHPYDNSYSTIMSLTGGYGF